MLSPSHGNTSSCLYVFFACILFFDFSVYIDTDQYPIKPVEQDSIPWIVVPDERGWGSEIIDLLNIQYIPFNLLIGPDGTIILRNIAAQEVAETIARSSEN